MVVFTIAFVTIAVLASLRSRNLVSQSYFSDGQHYQATIDARKRARQLSSPLELHYTQDGNILDIAMPLEHRGQDIRGTIRLYRPSGEKQDRTFPLAPDSTGSQHVILDAIPPGAWKVSIAWNLGDEEFLIEQNIFVNK